MWVDMDEIVERSTTWRSLQGHTGELDGLLPGVRDVAIVDFVQHIVREGKIFFPGLPRSYRKEEATEGEFLARLVLGP